MNTALTITGLTKKYSNFVLDNISFSIPSGSIVGLIGEMVQEKVQLLTLF